MQTIMQKRAQGFCAASLLFSLNTLATAAGSTTPVIATTSCPAATQGSAYAGCTLAVSGGKLPYHFSVYAPNDTFAPLPEGMSLDPATGKVSSALVGGQGYYRTTLAVTDANGATARRAFSFAISGHNAYLTQVFPADSIFHHRVDFATTHLPVDTSPAAPIPSVYSSATVKPFFGAYQGTSFPNGIPVISVPATQPTVHVIENAGGYQSYFNAAPIPAYAPVEGTSAVAGDRHVLVYRMAGTTQKPALYEMWVGSHNADNTWNYSSNALWSDTSSNALTPQGNGTSDAAGLPIAPLLVTADEVIGMGTASAPTGSVKHPIRFTLNHMLNYWVWPGTETAGVGSCSNSSGATLATGQLLSQASPPGSCTHSGAAGQIYRLKASVANPTCATVSPQAAVIIQGMRNYGIILADNGMSGGLIGTPDARWHDDDLACLRNLILGNFEPVNVSSLMLHNNSGQTAH